MSARDDIRRYVRLLADWWTLPSKTHERVEQVYSAVRTEVLHEVDARLAAMTLPEYLKGTFNAGSYADAWRDCRKVVQDMAKTTGTEPEEKATASAATATPRPAAGWHGARAQDRRLAQLLDAIRTQGGQWHTSRVMAVYKALGIESPTRATARGDLAALHAAGHLTLHDEPNRRFYTLSTRAERDPRTAREQAGGGRS